MGALDDMEFQLSGLDFNSPDDVPVWAEQVVLTKRQQRLVDQFAAEWRTELAHDLVARLNADAGAIRDQHDKTLAESNDAIRATLDVKKAMETGRMSSAEGLREITRLARKRAQTLEVVTAMRSSVERWDAMSNGTAEDFAAKQRGRFRNVPRTRRLTGAYLAGQEDSPFRHRRQ